MAQWTSLSLKGQQMAKKQEPTTVVLPDPKKQAEKRLCPVTGSKNDDFANIVLNQAVNTMWVAHSDKETQSKQINAALVGMMGVKPQDEIEGMLAAQMVAAHNAAMECFRRAMNREQTFEGRKENLNQANKLTRSYATMMEALSRYRGKGQQKMTVEHVHVHAGGQAIVGNVTRPEGGDAAIESEEQPYAKQITHAPEQAMPSPNAQGQPVPVTRNA